MMPMDPVAALGCRNLCIEWKPLDTLALNAPGPALEAVTPRVPSTETAVTTTAGSSRPTKTGCQFHSGDDVFLRTRDARFAAQLSRLPLLARVQAPLLVAGEPGTGRRCLARYIARLVAHPDPKAVAEIGAPEEQNAVIELDAHILTIAEVEQQLEDFRCALLRTTGATRVIARGNGDLRPQQCAEHARCLLVLDIHLLSPRAQATLLALFDAGVRATGIVSETGASTGTTDGADAWRIVATADDRLEEHARAGTFDSRLLAHLCAITVRMPRLRERSGDIVPLAMLFLRRECERTARALPILTPGAVNRLLAHSWHGNVPELYTVMQAAFARYRKDSITGDDVRLNEAARESDRAVASLRDAKRQLVLRFERSVLENLLQASQGNIAKAARLAQKNRRAFFELMRKHGIDADRFREACHGRKA